MTEPAFSSSATTSRALPPRPNGPRALPEPFGARAWASEAPRDAVHGRTAPGTGPTLALVPARALARPAARSRRPVHVVVAVGLTAGIYAV
jgi:hypothetical protein